jgi:hypothetical protein
MSDYSNLIKLNKNIARAEVDEEEVKEEALLWED